MMKGHIIDMDAQGFLRIHSSNSLWEWLEKERLSLGFTTYQTNRLMLVGRKKNGRLVINERLFDKPMGLYVQGNSLYMSTRYQIWRLDNYLAKGEIYQEADRLYVPSQSFTTGSLNVHDLVLGRDGKPLFINTDFSCLATIAEGYSFTPLWQPPFISKLVAEDRCHLNGLALVDGEPTYVTACSMTDSPAGWRSHRHDGGIAMHIPSNEVVVGGLSMPHSPRWYQGKLWILNAGTGELGYVDDQKFVPIAFCPGFVRGLAFWGDLAIVGLSKLRSASFSGLVLEERLAAEEKTAQCGLMVINLRSGETVHSLFLEQPIEELFDVVVLPNVVHPMSLGFQDEDIERLITFPNSNGLVTTKPTVKRPRDKSLAIAGLPTKERVDRENEESREYETLERQAQLAEAKVKFQRVFHLNPESLEPYEAMTFPSLKKRWQKQPQRGELIGVSASILGDMVGFAIAELLPNFKAEIISLFVEPNHRQKGIGSKILAFLEREIWSQKIEQIALVYEPTALTEKALERILRKLGWAAPRSLDNGFKVTLKGLATVNSPINEAARVKFETGKAWIKQQNLEQAIAHFQEAIRLQPDYVAAHNQLGNALQTLGQSEEAIACYQKVLEINPNTAAAHCNLGSIWQMQGKFSEAIAAYQQAINLKSDFALAHYNLGKLYHNQNQLSAAENCLQQALKLQPKNPHIHQELGTILKQIGRDEEALICFRNAITLNPQFSEAYYNLGCLLITKGQLKAAQQCFTKVLQTPIEQLTFNPSLVYSSLGFILESQHKFSEALQAYNQSLQLNPEATEIFYQREHVRFTLCDWDDFDHRVKILIERIQKHLETPQSNKLAPLSLNSFAAPIALHTAVNRHWSQTIATSIAELKTHCGFVARRFKRDKIRLGYLSADFRLHAVGFLIAEIFQHHDRRLFEVYAYSLADTTDEITTIIQQGCDVFVNIAALSVEAGARRIYADEIDILIDLGGYTTACRPEILALQPAPIQIQYLGYPDTMGAEFIQYILGDRQIIPPALAQHYTEQVIELPHTFIASPVEITADVPTRSALGLPETGFVYCCFNRTDKFDPHLFAAWMRILHEVPNSVLWLSNHAQEITQTLKTTAQSQGIAPERLVFLAKLPLMGFIAHLQRADLFLDTCHYNAGATAIAALQSGLPMLTCPGESFASRMGASICHTVGLDDFICENPQAYEEKAIYWGNHPQELQAIRDHLLQNKQDLPLFQPKQWVNHLDQALQSVWQTLISNIS